MFILGDELLDRLTCWQCKKYLSVKPVKVYPNRGIKCGRCSNISDAGVASLFGVLAEEALFRCVNRYEGCNQLLSYSDVKEHEAWCVGKQYECPCCVSDFKGTGYDIMVHFKEQHKERVLKAPEFVIELEKELSNIYMYCKNDLLFFINVRYNASQQEVFFNVLFVGVEQRAAQVTQIFTLCSIDGQIKHRTKRKSCCSFTGENMRPFMLGIKLDDYPKKVMVCKFDLNTENIDNLTVLPDDVKKSKLVEKDPVIKFGMSKVFGQIDAQENQEKKRQDWKLFCQASGEKPLSLSAGNSIIKPASFGQTSTIVSAGSTTSNMDSSINNIFRLTSSPSIPLFGSIPHTDSTSENQQHIFQNLRTGYKKMPSSSSWHRHLEKK